jgi:ABC-type phosphate transport system substrate-binding protein
MRLRRGAVLAVVLLCVAGPLGQGTSLRAQPEPAFRVIVNASSPLSALPKGDVARLFLKRTLSWKHGGKVVPVDLAEGSDVRATFSRSVLGKDVAAVKGYWQQLIFTGRGVPPVEKGSEAEVVSFVAGNPAAIGYVSAGTALDSRVKVLQVTN